MRVAVSGANGFVGRFVVSALGARGFEAVPLVRREQGIPGEVIINDLSSDQLLVVPPVTAMVHLAALTAQVDSSGKSSLRVFRRTNVGGTRRLLQAAHSAGVRRFVFMSTIKVNGEETGPRRPFRDTDTAQPYDDYATSKWEAEQLVTSYCHDKYMEWVIVRPPLVYGPGAGGNFKQLVRLALSGLPLPVASANNRRSLIYVENLADFLVQCAIARDVSGQIFLPSDGEATSTAELIRRIAAVDGRPARLFSFPPKLLGIVASAIGRKGVYRRLFGNLEVDSGPSAARLGWRPPFDLDQGLFRTLSDEP